MRNNSQERLSEKELPAHSYRNQGKGDILCISVSHMLGIGKVLTMDLKSGPDCLFDSEFTGA